MTSPELFKLLSHDLAGKDWPITPDNAKRAVTFSSCLQSVRYLGGAVMQESLLKEEQRKAEVAAERAACQMQDLEEQVLIIIQDSLLQASRVL